MSKTLLLICGLLSIASAVPIVHDDDSSDWSPNGLNQTEFRYYYTMVRGLLEGTTMGLYNNKTLTLNKACMDENSFQDIVKLEDLLSAGDIGGLFKSSASIYQLAYSFDKACDFNELFFQLGQWAMMNGTTLDNITVAFQKNLFQLTG
jgi:hypothetical protein